jgi:septal ring factor EnvC (AmiA/AmiB activator)
MKKNSQAFVNQLVVCLLVTMTFGGSLGLGTVWIRHQISLTAKANRGLLAAISELNRRSDDIEAQIRSEQRPELLRQLNLEFRLGLAPMNEVEVVRVTENVTQRMVQRATQWSYPEAARSEPITFKVAQR